MVTTPLASGTIAEYVAVYGQTRTTGYGYSIFEMQILGTALSALPNFAVSSLTGQAGSTLDLGTSTLTVGSDGLNTTFAGTITGVGILVKTGDGTLTLGSAGNLSNYIGGTTIQNGAILLGATNVLPTAAGTVTIGSASTPGTLDLGGFNQTLAGLASAGTATITNSGGNNSTLTFAGGTSSFGGTITDGATHTTALAVTSGSLTLTGTTSNYSGGTTLATGTTLTVANGAGGSATGNGQVLLNGGTLASAPTTGGTIAGDVVAGTAAHIITPGGDGTIGNLSVGSLTLNLNSTLKFNVTVAGNDTLTITNPVGAGLTIVNDPNNKPNISLNFANALTATGDIILATFPTTNGVTIGPATSSFNVNLGSSLLYGYTLVVEAGDIKLIAPPTLTWTGTPTTP